LGRSAELTWCTACPDWEDRIRQGRSLIPDLPLIASEADSAERAFDLLRLPDVPEQPYMADAAGQWQRDLVRAVFGAYDPEAGVRYIREFFCMVPKKSSKTTCGAAIMLVALLRNRRPRAEFLLIAPTLEIADLAFRQAVGMIEIDEVLAAKFQIQEHLKRIIYRPNGAFLKVKSFDPRVVTGSKPSGVLIDELHVIAHAHDADRVIGQLRGGLLPNPEAFLITITTQSERPPSGVFRQALMTARAVRDGALVLPLLPILYEFPEGLDWRDPANWHMVTPNNGLSVSVDRLVPDFATAVASGEAELRRWASQHLNIEIGLALKSDRWAGADFWEQAKETGLSFEAILERSEVICIGVDGGGLDDLLAIAVLGREKLGLKTAAGDAEPMDDETVPASTGTRRWLLWVKAWAHNSVLERRKSEAPRLRDLEREGDLVITDEMEEAFAAVADIAAQVDALGLLAKVGLDPMGVGAIVDALAERGIEGDDRVVGISQGWTLNGAIKTAEVKLASGALVHCGQLLMAWAVGNAKVEPRGNAITITKQTAGSAKIDPLMAAFDAVALMSRNPESAGSVYDTRDVLVL
jgi:phage terminase large subunit-like protein